jgi:hypothetical protein
MELQPGKDDPNVYLRELNGRHSSDGGYSTLFAGEDPRFRSFVLAKELQKKLLPT